MKVSSPWPVQTAVSPDDLTVERGSGRAPDGGHHVLEEPVVVVDGSLPVVEVGAAHPPGWTRTSASPGPVSGSTTASMVTGSPFWRATTPRTFLGHLSAYAYTWNGVPSGRAPESQRKLMAPFETRTHPCEAGYGGMLGEPWTA